MLIISSTAPTSAGIIRSGPNRIQRFLHTIQLIFDVDRRSKKQLVLLPQSGIDRQIMKIHKLNQVSEDAKAVKLHGDKGLHAPRWITSNMTTMNLRVTSFIVLFLFASLCSVAVSKTKVKNVKVWSDSESSCYGSYKAMDSNTGLMGRNHGAR